MSTLNYYVVLGIPEDADGDTIGARFERWRGSITPMPVPVRLPLNCNELVKLTRRWEIRTATPLRSAAAGVPCPATHHQGIDRFEAGSGAVVWRAPSVIRLSSMRVTITRSLFFDDVIRRTLRLFRWRLSWRRQ